jgi:hypothetical protein
LPHSSWNNYNSFHCIIYIFNAFFDCWWTYEFSILKFIFKLNFILTIFYVEYIFIDPNHSAIWNISWKNQILIWKLNYFDNCFILIFFIFSDINHLKTKKWKKKNFLFLPITPIRWKIDACCRLISLIDINLKKYAGFIFFESIKIMSYC